MPEEHTTISQQIDLSDLTTEQTEPVRSGPSGQETQPPADRPNETEEANLPVQTSPNKEDYPDLKLPQELNGYEENFAAFKKLAAELKLPAQTAQKLVEWESKTASEATRQKQHAREQILQRWTEQTRQLLGPDYKQKIADALAAAERFGGAELRTLLDATGLGNHPTVVKTFHQISQQITEDHSIRGRIRAAADKTFAEALYGKAQ